MRRRFLILLLSSSISIHWTATSLILSPRRDVLLLPLLSLTATTPLPNEDTAVSVDCAVLISPEDAIPGAYQNTCMTLPLRTVQLEPSWSVQIRQQTPAAGSTGMALWNSSLLLARLVLRMPLLRGQNVVELGCGGSALVSLAAAHVGAQHVLATDGNDNVLALARENIQQNNSGEPQIDVQTLRWGVEPTSDIKADIVLGADLTYQPSNWQPLMDTMAALLKDESSRIVYLTCGHFGLSAKAELQGFTTVAQQKLAVDYEATRQSAQLLYTQVMTPQEIQVVQRTGGDVQVLVLKRK